MSIWVQWLDSFHDVRNQFACYLHRVEGIMDQCVFLWAGAALIGLHVTVPFMTMLLDYKVTPHELLSILLSLYQDLIHYNGTMCQVVSCGIRSLAPYFLDPLKKESSPYGVEVCLKLEEYLKTADITVLDLYLKRMCITIAAILKRHR